ncbi:MAG: UDP-D-galactose:(glucosyl)lipopolysaccharide-1,6-D-galactosyltransferase [Methanomassiliicoccales archaeon PtaU1.Bin124]|nr:MAG: UDP-D-galactose:(glucosyl)lipopolysaccharide-1,6-D-galactosyltransferase [Methanomassiliicoccales archaeon PtaU1.Bin124]
MHVVILVRTFPHEIRNGFDAYAGSLIKEYQKEGLDFEVRTAKDERFVDDPKLSPIFYDLIYPMLGMLRRRKDRPVFHAISESQGLVFPFVQGKKVVTVHHINPLHLKLRDLYRPSTWYALFWRYCTDVAIAHADQVICISEQTKKELIDLYKIEEDKISVVSQAVADKFVEMPSLRKGRVVGYIGPFTTRKNIPALFQAFKRLHAMEDMRDVRLKICGSGPSGSVEEGMADPELAGSIDFRGEVSEQRIVAEYNELAALLYPSMHEGFGLGILEAQRCGVPVFILRDAKIPAEVAKHAIRCDSPDDMAVKVALLLRGHLPYDRKAAMDHASTFSESARAKRTIAIYESVDKGP